MVNLLEALINISVLFAFLIMGFGAMIAFFLTMVRVVEHLNKVPKQDRFKIHW